MNEYNVFRGRSGIIRRSSGEPAYRISKKDIKPVKPTGHEFGNKVSNRSRSGKEVKK